MQSKHKEYYLEAVQHMRKENYKDARDLFEILLYKDQKNVEYNLSMGLCLQKLGELVKAEEFYEYSYDKKPKEPKVLAAIFKFYDEFMKDSVKAQNYIEQLLDAIKSIDEKKYREYQLKYVKILEKNQEKEKLGTQFEDILTNSADVKNMIDVSTIYIPLKLQTKEIDVADPKRSSIYQLLSEKLRGKDVSGHFNAFESLMTIILNNTRKRFYEIEPSMICNSHYFDAIYSLLEFFPQTQVILSEVIRYIHCYLEGHIKYPLKLAIMFLLDNKHPDLVIERDRYKIFITFVKYFASDFLCTTCPELQPMIETLIQKQQIDVLDDDEDSKNLSLLKIPIKASQLFVTYQKEKMVQASDLLRDFNEKVKLMRSQKLDVSILEEISANLGYEVLIEPSQMIEMKNLLKVRINNKTYSLETYEKYFDYQMKLVKLLRLYDEEIPMRMIFDKILTETPDNLRIIVEREWLNFSESVDKKQNFIENLLPRYKALLENKSNNKLSDKIECTICKRLGTLHMVYEIPGALQYFRRASDLNPDDYQPLLGLGMISFREHQYSQAIELWQRAFNFCQTDYFLNQIILFGLYKIGLHQKAIEFALNIYRLPEVQNIFFVNLLLGQNYMSRGQFQKAHEFLQKAVDQFSFYSDKTYKVYHEKKMEVSQLGIPYFVCQNETFYFCDYPIFSSQYYTDNGMDIFSDTYYVEGKGLKIFHLELKLAELKKILGHQGSALKSIERAESLLIKHHKFSDPERQVKTLDKYLKAPPNHTKSKKLMEIVQKFNKISIRSRFVSTKKLKMVSLDQVYQVMVLSFESAQLNFFCKQEYYAQERIIQAFLCAIHILENSNQDISQMINVYVPFLFEMACHFINQTFQYYGYQQALQLSDEYHEIFGLQDSANIYSFECYRDFFFLRGTLKKDSHSFEQSLKFAGFALKQMGLDVDTLQTVDVKDLANQIQNSQQRKLLLKNNIFCYGLTVYNLLKLTQSVEHNNKLALLIKFGLSLFPQDDNLYLLLAISSDNMKLQVGALLQSCKFNPRNQWSLNLLGLIALQQKNEAWAQQLFLKSIESDPSSSVGYLGLALIGLQLFKYNQDLNNNLKELKEYDMFTSNSTFFAIIQTQQQIQQKVDSYIKYVQTLENKVQLIYHKKSFSNLLQLIVRHILVGTLMQEDEKQNIDYLMKKHLKLIPALFQDIIQSEVDSVIKENNLLQSDTLDQKVTQGFELFEQTISDQKNKSVFQNLSRFAKQLKVLLKLLLIKSLQLQDAQLLNENDAFTAAMWVKDTIYERFFNLLRTNLSLISYATTLVNYDQEFLNLVEVSFRNIRKFNIETKNQIHELLHLSSKIRLNCLSIHKQSLKSGQIINHIDQIIVTSAYEQQDAESYHKNSFMGSLSQEPTAESLKDAQRHLQCCILNNPSLRKYREVLNKFSEKSRRYNNNIFQQSIKTSKLQILQLCSFREMKWLDILLNQMGKINPNSENYESDIHNVYRIIKFKLLAVNDPQIMKSIQKIITDLYNLIELYPPENLIKLRQQFNSIRQQGGSQEKSRITLLVQQNNKLNTQSIVKNISKYLLPFEDQDYIYSKKVVGFLLPIILAMYRSNPNFKLIELSQEVLQHCLYAEQSLQSDLKLKKSRFVLNLVIYSLSIHQLSSPQDVGKALINLKEAADEFLSQGTFNSLSLSLYIHYTIVTEKYDELKQWLQIIGGYAQNKDFIAQWGLIVDDMQLAQVSCQDIERIRQFRRSTDHFIKNNKDLFSSPLTSLIYFLQGQVMMSSTDFQQYFTREQVLTRYQLSCLYYPSQANQIIKLLQPIKDAMLGQRQSIKQHDSDQEEEIRQKDLVREDLTKKKEKQGGLNSESDEDEVRLMDYEKDIEEFPEMMQQMAEEQMEFDEAEYSEEYMQAMIQQQQLAYMTPEQYQQLMIENARQANLESIQYMQQEEDQ